MPFISTSVCYGNSAEPPAIIIIVPDAPDDLEISLGPENVKARITDKVIESYYSFSRSDLKSTQYTIKVTTRDGTFEIKLDTPLSSYNNIFVLDLKTHTLTPGKSLSRSIKLVSLRVVLTLLIEGIVFYLFGFRKKRSWLIFLLVNLFTQGFLNIWLNNIASPLGSYLIFSLIAGEFLVFIIEMAAFLIFVHERERWLTAFYVILANFLSLIVGGYLITVFPM